VLRALSDLRIKTISQRCGICNRGLEKVNDPLSIDCGGDCWGCIGPIEADMGCGYAIPKVRGEYFNGLRPDWVPAPTINVECRNSKNISALVQVIHPDANPWANREFTLKITTKDKE
jgi:hypothetical protein